MNIVSTAFKHNGEIPQKYTCDGEDINPSLQISGFPPETRSLALIVDDPDAPAGTWVHWVVYDIPTDKSDIAENTVPGKEGINDFKKQNYGGPCPPSGTHRYFFKAYALDQQLDLQEGITKQELLDAMQGHILAEAELIGTYARA